VVTNNYTDSSFQVFEYHNEVSAERNSLKDKKPVGEREVNALSTRYDQRTRKYYVLSTR